MQRTPSWMDRAEMLTPPMPWDRPRWRPADGPTVVLLHGLWRGFHAMEPMARKLSDEGFATLNLPYPSTRFPIPALVEHVAAEVAKVAGDQPVHFVTHSLGGILVRSLLAQSLPWQAGRIVMLCPPNGGSEIVDWSKRHPLVGRLLGPAGRALGSDGLPPSLPRLPAGTQAAVIMGNRRTLPLFRKLLEHDNDGIVSVSRGKLDELRGFAVIHADHTFIQMHPEAIRLSTGFLRDGVLPQ